MSDLGFETTLEKVKRDREAHQQRRRDELDALFAEWLERRARSERGIEDDEEANANVTEIDRLALRITSEHSVDNHMIWRKFEVLEHAICANGDGTEWTDNREIMMLAGIKADLIGRL